MLEFIRQLKNGRLFGHPVHSMLVHFPSGLFPVSLIFDILGVIFQNHCLACAAFYSIFAGIILGFIAVIFGAIDYIRLSPSDTAWNKASLHALLSITWLLIFAVVLGLKLKHFPLISIGTWTEIGLSFVSVIGLIFSNYLGGDLIFRHHIGIEKGNMY